MHINTFTASQLYSFVQSPGFRDMPHIPITTHRALSYLHNPRGEEQDIVMLMCWEEEILIGYLGVLPDKWQLEGGECVKVGWMSCIWVHEQARGRGVAKQLMKMALEKWNYNLLATEFTDEAATLYHKSGFFKQLLVKRGLRCYYKWDLQTILPKKNALFSNLTWILSCIDSFGNTHKKIHSFLYFPTKTTLAYHILQKIDERAMRFIYLHQKKEAFKRNMLEWNWIKQFPWVLKREKTEIEEQRYAFSAYDTSFDFQFVTLMENSDTIEALFSYTLRNHQMKIPFLYANDAIIPKVYQVIMEILEKEGATTLIVYHPVFCKYLQEQKRAFIYKKEAFRSYLITNELFKKVDTANIYIQDGDGDCAFT